MKQVVTGADADPSEEFQVGYNTSIPGVVGTGTVSVDSPFVAPFEITRTTLVVLWEENLPTDWTIAGISCSSSTGTVAFTYGANEVQLTTDIGIDVECTFTNDYAETLP